jgi:hypothetical protein
MQGEFHRFSLLVTLVTLVFTELVHGQLEIH